MFWHTHTQTVLNFETSSLLLPHIYLLNGFPRKLGCGQGLRISVRAHTCMLLPAGNILRPHPWCSCFAPDSWPRDSESFFNDQGQSGIWGRENPNSTIADACIPAGTLPWYMLCASWTVTLILTAAIFFFLVYVWSLMFAYTRLSKSYLSFKEKDSIFAQNLRYERRI